MIVPGAKIARNIRSGLENLLLHKLRSFLTMLGVVFGVGSVVAMLSVGEGAGREALEQIRKLGSNNILISSVKPAEEQATASTRLSAGMSIYGLTYEDQLRMAESLEHVERVAPVKLLRQQGRLGERTLEVRVVGTTPEWFRLVSREVLAGRVLSPVTQGRSAPIAVLTEFGARRLLATRHSVGEWVRIGGKSFEIVGIVRSEGGKAGDLQMPDEEVDIYIPLPVARQYFGDAVVLPGGRSLERVELHQAIVQVDETENVEATARGIERMLSEFHKKKDYTVSVPLALLRQAEAAKRRSSIVLGSIAAISLLVGGIGIMNIMLASVTERTREIGIRRAIGAKRRQIIHQFLVETVVLSTTGGIIGLGMGALIPRLITHFSGMTTILTWKGVVLPLLISMTVGILFGLYPAIYAAQVDPIVALRHE
jgi:putative ABC transport system permease protein